MNSREFLCIALDINDGRKSRRFVQTLKSFASTFKVGLQLFSSTGPSIIERVREEGVSVFVDLKLNDIPNTVSAAVTELAKRGANLLTVHTLAGLDTLKAAKEAALKFSPSPKIIAVTVLTSIDKKALQEIGLEKEPSEMVLCLAAEAAKVGADGVV
ncbi:MAG: orotidine-5'-phosphate decarboxylase, partial [Planctomycetota bacterium]|nr:orotidine-5'-phosphate decarboxylase [Planctomycetota bacterium]